MVGTILSIGYGERAGNQAKTLAAHTIGSLLGGLILGVLLLILSLLMARPGLSPTALGVSGLLAVAYASHELGFARLPYPQIRRQVPRGWSYRYAPGLFSFLYGLVLGFGLVVHIHVATVFPVVVFGMVAGGFPALAVGLSFGAGRAASILLVHWARRFTGWTRSLQAVERVEALGFAVHPLNGLALSLIGGLLAGLAWNGASHF